MKKKVSQRLKKTVIMLIAMVAIIVVIWLISLLGNFVGWIATNWLPILIGILLASAGHLVLDLIVNNEKD